MVDRLLISILTGGHVLLEGVPGLAKTLTVRTLAEIISAPAQQTTATTLAPADRIGAYAGLYGFTQAAGQALGPSVGTALLDTLPDRIAWPLVGLCGVAAAYLYHRANHAAGASAVPPTPVV